MAKKSVVARQKKREVLIAKYADLRAKLKAAGDYEMHLLFVLKIVVS